MKMRKILKPKKCICGRIPSFVKFSLGLCEGYRVMCVCEKYSNVAETRYKAKQLWNSYIKSLKSE